MKRRGITIFRWISLTISFVILTYGTNIFGTKIKSITLPVFACEYVQTGAIDGVCKFIVDIDDYFFMNNIGSLLFMIVVLVVLIAIFGRLWCGYVCPFGFFQEILTSIRRKLKLPSYKLPDKIKPYLKLIKWGVFLMFILGIGFCELCPVRYIMPPLAGVESEMDFAGVIIAGIIIGFAFIKDRVFCHYCPLGIMMGFFNRRTSIGRIKKNGTACTHCRACVENCPMDIQDIFNERSMIDLTKSECIYCMKCIEVCPEEGALKFNLLGKDVLKSKRKK